MKRTIVLLAVVLSAVVALRATRSAESLPLKVLLVGGPAGDVRAQEFTSFLKSRVAHVESVSRTAFDPMRAREFDVVVLDWPQRAQREFARPGSPLGTRAAWSTPTVLVGSAGLALAITWDVRGGAG